MAEGKDRAQRRRSTAKDASPITRGGRVRCAIYTRKSSEEGLEQEFNSLDAQREACEAYIRSQKHEGWIVLPTLYDDPGYSGGNMERPALKRLLADIAAGKIDVVVVYKVDRLTRALADFAKIVEIFDARGVSFVSITQAFNTTTSMGRLTLNVLLSFAQFEREVTGERIRDKIAASKKKGLWMGGQPALGYDVKDRKLFVNEAEADTVRAIFREHPAIVDEDLWRQVQAKLEANGVERTGARDRAKLDYLLAGVLFDAEGQRMTPTHAIKKGVRYRYHVSRHLIHGVRASGSPQPGHRGQGQRAPAPDLERLVTDRLKAFFADADTLTRALPAHRRSAPDVKCALGAAAEIVRILAAEDGSDAFDLLRPFIARAQIHLDRIEIALSADRVADALLRGANAIEDSWGAGSRIGPDALAQSEDDRRIVLTIEAQLQRAGTEMRFLVDGVETGAPPDEALVRLLRRAHSLARHLEAHPSVTLEEAGAAQGMGAPYAARLMRLNFLAPAIVAAILNGRQPAALTATRLMADTRLPLAWSEQRNALGFA